MAAERESGYHPDDGTPNIDEVEERIIDSVDRELEPDRTIHFDIKARRGSKTAAIAAIAATPFAVKGAVDTLGPIAESLGEQVAHIMPESDHQQRGPTLDQVRESVNHTRATPKVPSPEEK